MKVTGTKEAFINILNERGVYKKLGVAISTVSNWKRALKNNESRNIPSIDLMESLLLKYGCNVLQEKVWHIPSDK